MKLIIERTYKEKQTLGHLKVIGVVGDENFCRDITLFECKTLELSWKDNKIDLSCIPEGRYKAVKHQSPKFDNSIWIKDVPKRSEILIHKGNFAGSNNPNTGLPDIKGCVLVGEDFVDIDGDGIKDITNSTHTINKLYNIIDNDIIVEVINE